MDFSGTAKWVIRIATATALFVLIIVILSSVTFPSTVVTDVVNGLSSSLSMFYYFVPTGSVLFPLCLGLWGLSFTILGIRYAVIGLRTLWKTSE
nr:MAG: hypothetical protein [uncultured bacterium]